MPRRLPLARLAALVFTLVIWLPPVASANPSAEAWRGELPIRDPWLRDHLPDDALVYVRTPNLFGFLSAPKGGVMDTALRSRANVENIERIRSGIIDNVLPVLPAFSDIRLQLLQQYLRSPIEIAVVMAPAPAGLLAVNLDIDSNEEFRNVLFAAGQGNSEFGLVAPLDESGVGELAGVGTPLFVKFDEETGQLIAHSGPAATAESFDLLLERMVSRNDHPMRAMERRIDESGQGIFLWIDAQKALPMMQLTMPAAEYADLTDAGIDKVSSAAMGWGVADGKGRLSIVADVLSSEDRGLLPVVSNDIGALSVGNPDAVLLFSIPSADEFARLEALALDSASAADRSEWIDGKAAVQSLTGISVEEVLRAVGPEIVGIFDASGDYMAVRLRDARLWDSIVDRFTERTDAFVEERRISGDTYYHLAFPRDQLAGTDDEDLAWLATLVSRHRDHLYWIRERDYLYMASLPQILVDRNEMRARTDVGRWLAEQQRINADTAIFSFSGTSRKLPMRLYGVYLEVMQLLSDISIADIDIWSMPTAAQLELPDIGTLGLTVSLGDPTIAAELTFENNPGEILGGFGGVFMTGVLAAIAIPAYQDYTIRANVSEGLSIAAGARAAVTEHYYDVGSFPGDEVADAMSVYGSPGEHTRSVVVEPDTGVIIVDYVDGSIPGGGQLMLVPTVTPGGSIDWSCNASIENKHLPAACRQ